MSNQQPVSCHCGSGMPDQKMDKITKAWFFECLSCGRIIGGLSEHETIVMWNAAMVALMEEKAFALSSA